MVDTELGVGSAALLTLAGAWLRTDFGPTLCERRHRGVGRKERSPRASEG